MASFKKNVYCDFEFLKKLRSSNSHFSPFASGDAMLFWFNTLKFILKSNIQLNIDTRVFRENIRDKEGDTFSELWKRVANGECEVHFLEDHNIKFVENKICMDDATQYAYLIKERKAITQHYAKSLGVIAFSPDSWISNTDAKSLEYLYKDSGCEIPKSERMTWKDILRSKEYHLSDCNAMVITDNYLLESDTSIQKNLYPILDELLPQKLINGIEFHLTIVTANKNNKTSDKFASIFKDLKKEIKELRPDLSIKVEIYVENDNGSLHDRAIVTNNVKIEIPGGFDLINKHNNITKETKVSILYPGVQSFSEPCDGTYMRILTSCRKIADKIRRKTGGIYWSNFDKDKVNRLLLHNNNE